MRTKLEFENPETKEVRTVKVGWSWTLLLFSTLLGLPLFLRGLTRLGFAFLMLNVIFVAADNLPEGDLRVLTLLLAIGTQLFGSIWVALRGNELTARRYLRKGWLIRDANSAAASRASQRWHLENASRYALLTEPLNPGHAILSVVALALFLGVLILTEGSGGQLEFYHQNGMITARNVGDDPIEIQGLIVNGRPDCRVASATGPAFTPVKLKSGPVTGMTAPSRASCQGWRRMRSRCPARSLRGLPRGGAPGGQWRA